MTTHDYNFIKTDKIGIFGTSGCGKTYLTDKICSLYPRKVIFDTLHDPTYNQDDYIHVKNINELGYWIKNTLTDKTFTIIYHFDPDGVDRINEFDTALKLCYTRGDILIVIEEVQLFATTNISGMPQYLFNCILTGRHKDIAVICTTQRPGLFNKTILSQCSHIFIGHLAAPTDIDYFSRYAGVDEDIIKDLQKRQFIYKNPYNNPILVKNNLQPI
jgi:hypothetical protein